MALRQRQEAVFVLASLSLGENVGGVPVQDLRELPSTWTVASSGLIRQIGRRADVPG